MVAFVDFSELRSSVTCRRRWALVVGVVLESHHGFVCSSMYDVSSVLQHTPWPLDRNVVLFSGGFD